jgi:phosphoenolpyruvate-protein phosphotransferase (PTS system enzyme I)
VLLMQNPLVIRFPIAREQVAEELARLEDARERSRRQLLEIKARVARGAAAELGYLFEAQLLMIDDPMLLARARDLVEGQQVNAEWAVQRAFEDLSAIFEAIEDAYLRERRGDVADVVGRLRMNLGRARGRGADLFRDIDTDSVLIADELTPSMAAQVDWRKIQGFASDTGSRTHHTAILARSLHVPAVVGLALASTRIQPGTTVVIDGTVGELIVDPPSELVDEIRRRGSLHARPASLPARVLAAAPATVDGTTVALQANLEMPDDLSAARASGATGVGLFRSEFLLAMTPAEALTEDAQYTAYRSLVEGMAPGVVTIRTFDVDENQLQSWPRNGSGAAPAAGADPSRGPLGLRAIRLCLSRRELFKTQLRALLRASQHGRMRIIFPFVSGVDEFRQAKEVLREALDGLSARGTMIVNPPPVGVMIEIPSAAVTADLLAREADFFSIGTNDLIQYVLAVDRTDARVSHLFEPLHPAVLRTLRAVLRAAARQHLPVSLCGEMASDPAILPLLIGLGLRDFSMSPAAIPAARSVVRDLRVSDARRLADRVMRLATTEDIARCLAHGPSPAHAGTSSTRREPRTGGTSGQR